MKIDKENKILYIDDLKEILQNNSMFYMEVIEPFRTNFCQSDNRVSFLKKLKDECFYKVYIKNNNDGYEHIEELRIPLAIRRINSLAFALLDLKKIYIHENVDYLEFNTFSFTKAEVIFDENTKLEKIAGYSFEYYLGEKIKIVNNITYICGSAFHQSVNLKEVELPETLKDIWSHAFYDCVSLQYINLDNVKAISYCAFACCQALESVNLSNVKALESGVFKHCISLNNINNLNSIKNLDGTEIFLDTKLKEYKIFEFPKNMESVNLNALDGLKIKFIKLPNKIENFAFPSWWDGSSYNTLPKYFIFDGYLSEVRKSYILSKLLNELIKHKKYFICKDDGFTARRRENIIKTNDFDLDNLEFLLENLETQKGN